MKKMVGMVMLAVAAGLANGCGGSNGPPALPTPSYNPMQTGVTVIAPGGDPVMLFMNSLDGLYGAELYGASVTGVPPDTYGVYLGSVEVGQLQVVANQMTPFHEDAVAVTAPVIPGGLLQFLSPDGTPFGEWSVSTSLHSQQLPASGYSLVTSDSPPRALLSFSVQADATTSIGVGAIEITSAAPSQPHGFDVYKDGTELVASGLGPTSVVYVAPGTYTVDIGG